VPTDRYLTKTRFKLAAECPRKLFYSGKTEYFDKSREDSFLAALAEGGYQVGELARASYPDGVLVEELENKPAIEKTLGLLALTNVTIFEAALVHENLFIRVDILRKYGNFIELIEVKAKSYSASEDGDFRGKKGKILAEYLPYLQDVTFQKHVAQKALPAYKINASLLLANKDALSTVDGINQKFKLNRFNGRLLVASAPDLTVDSLGAPLLVKINVDSQVEDILASHLRVGPNAELSFDLAVSLFAKSYEDDNAIAATPSSLCAKCQFKLPSFPLQGIKRSGFHECWTETYSWNPTDFERPNVLDLWNFKKKDELISHGIVKLSSVGLHDIGFEDESPLDDGLTHKHRQWFMCQPDWPGGGEYYLDIDSLKSESSNWTYPLHCIDFETCTVAIPFIKGRHPYETTAFQFSHHIIEKDGSIRHQTQWLNTDPGIDPNVYFLRALRQALSNDKGSIFRWANHENTVLNQLRMQILNSQELIEDKEDLVAFLESITTRKSVKESIVGNRSMIDLCKLAEKFYFHPMTNGSSSLKKVLPALMHSSVVLKEIYAAAWYGPNISLNHTSPIAWWQIKDGVVLDPYKLLPPVFDDISITEIEEIESNLPEELRDGGAAMSAYSRLQFEDVPPYQRTAIRSALLRYCELDTLAMVMVLQAWGVVPATSPQ
jgi:hypothetical protein